MFWLVALAGLLMSASPSEAATKERFISLEVGHSHIFEMGRGIRQAVLSDPTLVEVETLNTGHLQIRGLRIGSTDLWLWFNEEPRTAVRYEVHVHRDDTELKRRIEAVVHPASPPDVFAMQDQLVVQGPVPDLQTLEAVAALASAYDEGFINLMTVQGDHQVQLEVIFAEVSRSSIREMGVQPLFSDGGLLSGADLDLGIKPPVSISEAFQFAASFDGGFDLSAVLSVLESNNVTKVLARPTLTVLSGQQAEFMAGGELPIPVAQFGERVTIEFKGYGVKLTFVPTVLAQDVIDIRVYVEVSDLDATNAVTLTDVSIPAFATRKSQSHLRLESGMTFAMAGMLNEVTRSTVAKVPLLGDIPIIGSLFRYVKHRRDESELMIFVRPRLVRPLTETPDFPGAGTANNPSDFRLFMMGMGDVREDGPQPTRAVGVSR
jgi:pilus assembly protein CpaC